MAPAPQPVRRPTALGYRLWLALLVLVCGRSVARAGSCYETTTSGCVIAPISWYTSCPDGYSEDGTEGCAFLRWRYKCVRFFPGYEFDCITGEPELCWQYPAMTSNLL